MSLKYHHGKKSRAVRSGDDLNHLSLSIFVEMHHSICSQLPNASMEVLYPPGRDSLGVNILSESTSNFVTYPDIFLQWWLSWQRRKFQWLHLPLSHQKKKKKKLALVMGELVQLCDHLSSNFTGCLDTIHSNFHSYATIYHPIKLLHICNIYYGYLKLRHFNLDTCMFIEK